MNAPSFQRAKEIFLAAIEAPVSERSALVHDACGTDANLFAQVQELLGHSAEDAGLRVPELSLALHEALNDDEPEVIDGYQILRRLGQGGMGTVFLAEQSVPVRRQVALKVIRRGMDTREVIARFQAERQALARMSHPNVAAVHDAGKTADGRPYFVMEYVPGQAITDYCERHSLTHEERLHLMQSVCAAVQHAHQKGLIHRDLKPSNVLVREDRGGPLVKVIDFGVAKALHDPLTDVTLVTQAGGILGTPAYMSPEQARGDSATVDTRTDVYSLGALLYHLLTGFHPFAEELAAATSLADAQRIICASTAMRPSVRIRTTHGAQPAADADTRSRHVRGDLDWIVMKCLEKEPDRRYDSAAALSVDIARFLALEPVSAGPPSRTYRVRKFVQRNLVLVASAALLTIAIGVGSFGTVWFALAARGEALRAHDARGKAVQAANAEREARRDEAAARLVAQRRLAETFVQAANLARQRGQWHQALRANREAIALGEVDVVACKLGMIEAHDALNQMDQAWAILESLTTPGSSGPHRGRVLLWQGELTLLEPGGQSSGLALFREAIASGLPPADLAFARAMITPSLKEHVSHLQAALQADPFHRRSVQMLGLAHLLAGNGPAALRCAHNALSKFPEDPSTAMSVGIIGSVTGDRESIATASEAMRQHLRPNEVVAMQQIFLTIETVLDALREREPSEIGPALLSQVMSQLGAAQLAIANSEPTAGEVDFGGLLNRMPPVYSNTWGLAVSSMFAAALGDVEGALSGSERALTANPEGTLAFFRASVLGKAGMPAASAEAHWIAASLPSAFPIRRISLLSALEWEMVVHASGTNRRDRIAAILEALMEVGGLSSKTALRLSGVARELDLQPLAIALLSHTVTESENSLNAETVKALIDTLQPLYEE